MVKERKRKIDFHGFMGGRVVLLERTSEYLESCYEQRSRRCVKHLKAQAARKAKSRYLIPLTLAVNNIIRSGQLQNDEEIARSRYVQILHRTSTRRGG